MPIQWSHDTAGRAYEADGQEHGDAPDPRQRSGMWNNMRSMLGSGPSGTGQDPKSNPPGGSRAGSQGFRPFSAFSKSAPSEMLKLPRHDQEQGQEEGQAQQPGAADWQSFMKSECLPLSGATP
jgi:hypothetical protein